MVKMAKFILGMFYYSKNSLYFKSPCLIIPKFESLAVSVSLDIWSFSLFPQDPAISYWIQNIVH